MNTIASVTLPHHVHAPRYDRQQLQSRIVHFGFGAFHRAHQALLTQPEKARQLKVIWKSPLIP
ncbi:hypothetical protein AAIH74_36080, partial [Pseudomonas aeruginosa]|uniref:hypothetical protein n=1 Tax=Pseudomonas aeruginosa TaxID=287 RepID=UPI0031B6853B